ncbi:MAG: 1-deoxy-D-xylulose-5-phosphate reductoisomerase, partial [Gammaproteobacteria bacterium]
MARQSLCLLGSTGSIGRSTLDVIARHPDRYRVESLAACRRVDLLFEQICAFHPERVVMVDAEAAARLSTRCRDAGLTVEVLSGSESLAALAASDSVDTVLAAIVGAAGLLPTLAAVRAGKRVLLANKEALVMSGELMMSAARESGARILPVDSEHNAIF